MTHNRVKGEISHGKYLSENDPELLWGWGTPAGRQRASRRAKLIAEGAGLRPGITALEIGCGVGMFTEEFARTGASILAVDISPDLLKKARSRGLPEDKVRFVEAPFEELDLDSSFDAVIGSSVLHHLDMRRSIVRIFKLLKPGGCFSFAEPNYLNPQVFCERAFRFLPYFSYISPDETAFVRWRLTRILKSAGFSQITITPFDWLHPSTPPGMINTVSKLGHTLEGLAGIREFSGSLHIRCIRPHRI